MEIKEFVKKIESFKAKAPLHLDNTPVIASRRTNQGAELAGILDFRYDNELGYWIVEVKNWEDYYCSEKTKMSDELTAEKKIHE